MFSRLFRRFRNCFREELPRYEDVQEEALNLYREEAKLEALKFRDRLASKAAASPQLQYFIGELIPKGDSNEYENFFYEELSNLVNPLGWGIELEYELDNSVIYVYAVERKEDE